MTEWCPVSSMKFPRGVMWYWIGFRSSKHQNILVMCFSPRLIMWGQGIAVRHQNDSHQKCMQCTKTKRDNAMFFFEIKRTFRAAAFPHILACSKTNNAAKPELSMSPRCLANIMRNFYFLMRVSDFLNIIKGITFFKNYFFLSVGHAAFILSIYNEQRLHFVRLAGV